MYVCAYVRAYVCACVVSVCVCACVRCLCVKAYRMHRIATCAHSSLFPHCMILLCPPQQPHQMREERNSDREREVTQQTRDAAELTDLKERLLRLQEENRKLQSKVRAGTMS